MEKPFLFNPFCDIEDLKIDKFIIPIFELKEVQGNHNVIELIGKKGRGKTTHLKWISQELLVPFYRIDNKTNLSHIIKSIDPIIIIDEIDRLHYFQRRKLFLSNKQIIIGTRFSKRWELFLIKKKIKSIQIKGINTTKLKQLVFKRLTNFEKQNVDISKHLLSKQDLQELIKTNKDDYRKIINNLFKKYNELH